MLLVRTKEFLLTSHGETTHCCVWEEQAVLAARSATVLLILPLPRLRKGKQSALASSSGYRRTRASRSARLHTGESRLLFRLHRQAPVAFSASAYSSGWASTQLSRFH